MTKSFRKILPPLLLLALLGVTAPARGDDGGLDSDPRSGAEIAADAERAEALHAEWLTTLRANPAHPLLVEASRKNPFRRHPEKMRCWVSGVSAILGAQTGVCKSAGRKYAFSAITFGASVGMHAGRLRLVSSQPFPDAGTKLNGERASLHIVFGYERYWLQVPRSETRVRGGGVGIGLDGSADLVWGALTRID